MYIHIQQMRKNKRKMCLMHVYITSAQIQRDIHTHTPPLGRKNKLLKIWHLSSD